MVQRLSNSVGLIELVDNKDLSTQALVQLIEVYDRLADLCLRWKRENLATAFNKKAYDLIYPLYVSSPQNSRYQRALATAWANLGKAALEKKHFESNFSVRSRGVHDRAAFAERFFQYSPLD